MDFFKSILSEDPDPNLPNDSKESQINASPKDEQKVDSDDDDGDNVKGEDNKSDSGSDRNPNSSTGGVGGGGGGGGGWSFGSLVKTLQSRSESVLETYRRDLKEFGTGLKKETDLFREVASRAVKELPASIEVGASAIDGVLKSTAEMIAQGKDALLAHSDVESDASESHQSHLNSRRYSRFDSQLNAIQNDPRTYCDEPEDLEDYGKWKLGFVLDEKRDEIESLIGDNGVMESIYKKLVPNEVDQETFWYRYFYRMLKLKQQEDLRANLVKRSLSADDEEELTWDVDDDEDEQEAAKKESKPELKEGNINNGGTEMGSSGASHDTLEKNASVGSGDDKKNANATSGNDETKNTNVASTNEKGNENVGTGEKVENLVPESEERGVVDSGESAKDSDVTIVSTQPSLKVEEEEEDLGWDEIEDLGSSDEKKVESRERVIEARKGVSTAEEDEDLSWDIEDNDDEIEPKKA